MISLFFPEGLAAWRWQDAVRFFRMMPEAVQPATKRKSCDEVDASM